MFVMPAFQPSLLCMFAVHDAAGARQEVRWYGDVGTQGGERNDHEVQKPSAALSNL